MVVIPKNQDLDIIFLIDKSGSMYGCERDTIGGFNSFVEKERKNEFNTKVSTILFNHGYDVLYKRKSINEVRELTENEYHVSGSTALLDAIGRTITSLDKEIDNKVLFVIMTDGYENSSIEFSKSQIRNMVNNHSWEFIFIGADIDSYSEGANIGFRKERIANFKKSSKGFDDVYTSIGDIVDDMRCDRNLDDGNWRKRLNKYD